MKENRQEELIRKIRTDYTEREVTKLDELRDLDRRVKRPATVFAYVYGSISAVIMGCGMSLIMTDIAAKIGLSLATPMISGIAVGVVGLGMALLTYPIYKGMLSSRRKKYADRILSLSDALMKE